jgi:hypothetical protein
VALIFKAKYQKKLKKKRKILLRGRLKKLYLWFLVVLKQINIKRVSVFKLKKKKKILLRGRLKKLYLSFLIILKRINIKRVSTLNSI